MNCCEHCGCILGSIYGTYCLIFCFLLCKTEYNERQQLYKEIKEEYDGIETILQRNTPLHTIEEVVEEV
jgi:hypothetical protein